MKYIIILVLLSFFTLLQASSTYPKLYAKQGTPLYKSANKFKSFNKLLSLKLDVTSYLEKLKKTKKIGIKADNSSNKADKIAYLKILRSLQSTHDKVVKKSIKMLLDSIKKNNYKKFLKITHAGIRYYRDKPRLKERIVSYYKKNRYKKKSKMLDKVARIYTKKIVKKKKKAVEQVEDLEWTYTIKSHINPEKYKLRRDSTTTQKEKKRDLKKIILISSPNCQYCVKAKALFKRKGLKYTEYGARTSRGKALYQKYKGTGVPLIIIGDQVIRGYSESKILDAVK